MRLLDGTQHCAHLGLVHGASAIRNGLIQQTEGIPHASAGLTGDEVQTVNRNLDFFLNTQRLKVRDNGIQFNASEIIALTA